MAVEIIKNIITMKKFILIPLLFICLIGFGQMYDKKDSIRYPNGADTTVYKSFFSDEPYGISFDYSNSDAVNGVLELGDCPVNDGSIFNAMSHDSLPYTMAYNTVSFKAASFNHAYLAIKVTKGGNTAGLYIIYYITRNVAYSYLYNIYNTTYLLADAWDKKYLDNLNTPK